MNPYILWRSLEPATQNMIIFVWYAISLMIIFTS